MAMTLAELIDHTDNLTRLLVIKRSQLSRMGLDSVARGRHERAITALEGRVGELRRRADELRGDEPALKCVRPLPSAPPLVDMVHETKPISDLPAAPGYLGSELF